MNRKKENELISHNLALYATFYPKYYLLEANIKKGIYDKIKMELGNDWFANQIEATEKDSLFAEELAFILRRKPHGFSIKDQGLLVEAGLGFWVEFFNKRIFKMTKGVTISVFTDRPKYVKRKDIYQKLTLVKDFRNQLFHSRVTIVVDKSQIDVLDELVKINHELNSLLSWMEVSGLPENLEATFNNEVGKVRQLI